MIIVNYIKCITMNKIVLKIPSKEEICYLTYYKYGKIVV